MLSKETRYPPNAPGHMCNSCSLGPWPEISSHQQTGLGLHSTACISGLQEWTREGCAAEGAWEASGLLARVQHALPPLPTPMLALLCWPVHGYRLVLMLSSLVWLLLLRTLAWSSSCAALGGAGELRLSPAQGAGWGKCHAPSPPTQG